MTVRYKANLILTLLHAGGNQDISKAFTNSPISLGGFLCLFFLGGVFKYGRALASFVFFSLHKE